MIKWITDELGVGPKSEVIEDNCKVVDVRDLVDKKGNLDQLVLEKIETGIRFLEERHKVAVCCDYGLSRSNAIAIGILVRHYHFGFDEAVRRTLEKTQEEKIQLEMLHTVRNALGVGMPEKRKSQGFKTAIITGAGGFLGTSLVDLLRRRHILATPSKDEIDLAKGPVLLDLLVQKTSPDVLIHLANPGMYTTTQAMGEMIVMLKNVLDVCLVHNLPLLYPSSWVVYSGYDSVPFMLASEELDPWPKGTYGEAKFLCETLINQYVRRKLRVAIIRFSPIYGVGGDKPKFIRTFFEQAKSNVPIYTHKYQNGFPALDLLHVEDAVRGIEAVVDRMLFETIHIGNGVLSTTLEIAQAIKDICGSQSDISWREIYDRNANIIMDITKAKKTLSWTPEVRLHDGLAEIYASISSQA